MILGAHRQSEHRGELSKDATWKKMDSRALGIPWLLLTLHHPCRSVYWRGDLTFERCLPGKKHSVNRKQSHHVSLHIFSWKTLQPNSGDAFASCHIRKIHPDYTFNLLQYCFDYLRYRQWRKKCTSWNARYTQKFAPFVQRHSCSFYVRSQLS